MLSRADRVDRLLENVVQTAILPHLTDEAKRSYRVTIHIPDVLFEDALYQLLDYYPAARGGAAHSPLVSVSLAALGGVTLVKLNPA